VNDSSSKSGHSLDAKLMSAFDDVVTEIEYDGILDHEVRAIEVLMAKKKLGFGRRKYKIHKFQSNSLDSPKKGYAYVYSWGAEICYSPHGTRLQKMIAVGHELGHILFEHIGLENSQNSSSFGRVDPEQEEEAYKFAELMAKRRSKQYSDKTFVQSRQHTDSQIEIAIREIHPNYVGFQ